MITEPLAAGDDGPVVFDAAVVAFVGAGVVTLGEAVSFTAGVVTLGVTVTLVTFGAGVGHTGHVRLPVTVHVVPICRASHRPTGNVDPTHMVDAFKASQILKRTFVVGSVMLSQNELRSNVTFNASPESPVKFSGPENELFPKLSLTEPTVVPSTSVSS